MVTRTTLNRLDLTCIRISGGAKPHARLNLIYVLMAKQRKPMYPTSRKGCVLSKGPGIYLFIGQKQWIPRKAPLNQWVMLLLKMISHNTKKTNYV